MPGRRSQKRSRKVAPRLSGKNLPRRWGLQAAEARFDEVFRRARSEGPQLVTRRDKEAVVILSAEDYERLKARPKQPASLVQFFAESPLAKAGINLERKPDPGRQLEL